MRLEPVRRKLAGRRPDLDSLGAIDGDPGIRPQFHTFTASKAPWDQICDGLPEHPDRYTGPAA